MDRGSDIYSYIMSAPWYLFSRECVLFYVADEASLELLAERTHSDITQLKRLVGLMTQKKAKAVGTRIITEREGWTLFENISCIQLVARRGRPSALEFFGATDFFVDDIKRRRPEDTYWFHPERLRSFVKGSLHNSGRTPTDYKPPGGFVKDFTPSWVKIAKPDGAMALVKQAPPPFALPPGHAGRLNTLPAFAPQSLPRCANLLRALTHV